MSTRVPFLAAVLLSAPVAMLSSCGTPGDSCSPSNCEGCCEAGVCRSGVAPAACGAGGLACISCGDGLVCSLGMCTPGSSGGSGGAGGNGGVGGSGGTGGTAGTGGSGGTGGAAGAGDAGGTGGGTPTSALRVFTSATDFRGDLSTIAGVSGARAGDVLCQRIAQAQGLSGTWGAYLTVDGGVASERFTANGPWVITGGDGGVAFNSLAAVRISTPSVTLNWDEAGEDTLGRNTWTGRGLDFWGVRSSCDGWSTRASTATGGVGWPAVASAWSEIGDSHCTNSEGLLCFEQAKALPDGGAQPSLPRTATKQVFRTSSQFNGNLIAVGGGTSGTAAADAICQAAATAGGLTGTWKAWLSEPGHPAAGRFTYRGPWSLVGGDGGVVASTVEQLLVGRLGQPIARDELGRESTNYGVWTGTYAGGEIADETCLGWTTANLLEKGLFGTSNRYTTGWQDFLSTNCNSQSALFCFQQ